MRQGDGGGQAGAKGLSWTGFPLAWTSGAGASLPDDPLDMERTHKLFDFHPKRKSRGEEPNLADPVNRCTGSTMFSLSVIAAHRAQEGLLGQGPRPSAPADVG